MANATLRERQTQYKSCPLSMYLITPGSAVISSLRLCSFATLRET
ncbi:hypothetical protein PN478_17480 [Dolichospermum circinale CS-534/05]|nr:hypothetical protein [Dolichospermum circinale]MDB9462570.1 hypothetical protein [Dolichospermum circinale CS-541/04]MDB9492298.1 hypothetical protein [Dolichospermum circinale CS-534/05]MDB9546379.1 hypothetical protein [Dolichospermum circinale CS-1031]